MPYVCRKCGRWDRFRAVQRYYAELIVDGHGRILEDLGVTDCTRPEVRECCACGSTDVVWRQDGKAG